MKSINKNKIKGCKIIPIYLTLKEDILAYVKISNLENIVNDRKSIVSIIALTYPQSKAPKNKGNFVIYTHIPKEAKGNYVSSQGAKVISNLLHREFLKAFYAYMSGALSVNGNTQIKDAIISFCRYYGIEFNKKEYEKLRKDWNRYLDRESRGEPSILIKKDI